MLTTGVECQNQNFAQPHAGQPGTKDEMQVNVDSPTEEPHPRSDLGPRTWVMLSHLSPCATCANIALFTFPSRRERMVFREHAHTPQMQQRLITIPAESNMSLVLSVQTVGDVQSRALCPRPVN